jgi:predicted nucleotidyltransferase
MRLTCDDRALRAAGARLVVVFGSVARGSARPDSDLDAGVLFDAPADGSPLGDPRLEAVAAALSSDRPIDLVPLDEADPLLLHEVAVEGRPVFEAEPGTFEVFRLRAVVRYLDTAWLRRLEAAALDHRR